MRKEQEVKMAIVWNNLARSRALMIGLLMSLALAAAPEPARRKAAAAPGRRR
jgi:hypothetical protein